MKKFLNLNVALELTKYVNPEEELKLLERVVELLRGADGVNGIINNDLVKDYWVLLREQSSHPLV